METKATLRVGGVFFVVLLLSVFQSAYSIDKTENFLMKAGRNAGAFLVKYKHIAIPTAVGLGGVLVGFLGSSFFGKSPDAIIERVLEGDELRYPLSLRQRIAEAEQDGRHEVTLAGITGAIGFFRDIKKAPMTVNDTIQVVAESQLALGKEIGKDEAVHKARIAAAKLFGEDASGWPKDIPSVLDKVASRQFELGKKAAISERK